MHANQVLVDGGNEPCEPGISIAVTAISNQQLLMSLLDQIPMLPCQQHNKPRALGGTVWGLGLCATGGYLSQKVSQLATSCY